MSSILQKLVPKPEEREFGDFLIETKEIGDGGFSKVYLRTLSIFYHEDDLCLVTEYLGGGDLWSKGIENTFFGEKDLKKAMRDVLSGMLALLKAGLLHRDIKPESILRDEKGSLFKISRQKQQPDDISGSYEHMAPEQIRMRLHTVQLLVHPNELSKSHEKYMSTASEKTEVWAAGITAWFLLIKTPVFDTFGLGSTDTLSQKIQKIYKEMYTMDYAQKLKNTYITRSGREWLSKMVDLNPETRITMEGAYRHKTRSRSGVSVRSVSPVQAALTPRRRLPSPVNKKENAQNTVNSQPNPATSRSSGPTPKNATSLPKDANIPTESSAALQRIVATHKKATAIPKKAGDLSSSSTITLQSNPVTPKNSDSTHKRVPSSTKSAATLTESAASPLKISSPKKKVPANPQKVAATSLSGSVTTNKPVTSTITGTAAISTNSRTKDKAASSHKITKGDVVGQTRHGGISRDEQNTSNGIVVRKNSLVESRKKSISHHTSEVGSKSKKKESHPIK
ncbi:CAMK CDPK kinase [Pyrrhoderma noxium]|uniref:non-specific serine/threonine protein kinase n=1 Tax=Pyrrhoderma noxium TaxID=2282107 RepID=A0A286UD38_9AGAM|nr:CAMK CDPK kinase [Pyrrhoderma noxium]